MVWWFWKRKKRAFEVYEPDRDILHYEEGDKVMGIGRGLITDGKMFVLESSIDRWKPPHENEEVTQQDRERIKRNIEVRMAESGIEVTWDDECAVTIEFAADDR